MGLWLVLCVFILFSCAKPPREVAITAVPIPQEPSKPVPGWLKPYTVNGKTYFPLPKAEGYEEICTASWYGPGFHGRQASGGEIYNMYEYTAAHKLLPMGTYVLVTNLENGRQLVVRINDRGPFVEDRCLDLSYASARELGIIGKGTARVKIVALSEGELIGQQVYYKNRPNLKFNEFYLQIAAFKDYGNALRLKEELERNFAQVRIEPYQHPERGLFYRVQIYLSNNLDSALSLADKYKRERFAGAFLVAK
ncbi:MAG: septal ring lytic transglycosylase RlpA family protein [Caldimicrobium sp.]|nr:septal ring lytic transglycosylase RlpA family protein [Caldimicrobium sp.]MCX7872993.1 septal ring lytic transglycosylase RlpA family protein [Caldimicrobium sp.]